MMYSDPDRDRAEYIVARLIAQTGEENLARRIDEPVDRAAELFEYPPDQPHTADRFHEAITAFVRCLYENASLFGRTLTHSQAHDEAVALLARAYQGDSFGGYDAALTDAAYSAGSGIRLVLDRLKNLIKARLRREYKRWVFLRYVDPADWQARRAVAAFFFERCLRYMPPELARCSPDQFTDEVLMALIEIYAALQ